MASRPEPLLPARRIRSPILHRGRAAVHCLVTAVGATIGLWLIFS
jgi:hypothetical protein